MDPSQNILYILYNLTFLYKSKLQRLDIKDNQHLRFCFT